MTFLPASEGDLVAVAAILAGPDAPLTDAESALVRKAPLRSFANLQEIREAIVRGDDPLGSAFSRLRSPEVRRTQGAVYTPRQIVDAMIAWAVGEGTPARLVDPGAGSGRFLLAGARAFPDAELVAAEIDPLAALMLRANAAVHEVSDRLTLHLADYRTLDLQEIHGATLFVGNPPYVRHHEISPYWKTWFADAAAACGLKASKLAGLHIHFFVKTRQLARQGDYGAFITSAEWLDVNYGAVLRELLTNGLGGASLHVIAPSATPFADTATTGAITCFRVGRQRRSIAFRSVDNLAGLGSLPDGRPVTVSRLDTAGRWSPLLRPAKRLPRGYSELGELCSVHRGQVTGCNAVWVASTDADPLPESVLVPTVTRARELFQAGGRLVTAKNLRSVVDLPVDLEALDPTARDQVRRFLRWAESMGAHRSYVATNRRAWWSVNLRDPAPILCTYMARRPPAFVRNLCGARHLNIAHGIYPREPLAASVLDSLSTWLHDNVCVSSGRTYAGGLTKFEPKEIERIPIPPLETLNERSKTLDIGETCI